jgi:uncharacterized protein YjbJ (UPF0337 family)
MPQCFPYWSAGYPLRMSASKKAKNTFDRLAGQAKEKLGQATGDNRLRNEGKTDQVKARLKMTGERLKDAVRGR